MLLTVRSISKHYGPRLLFSGISLGIDEGQRIGLIGANGSGKSTLLRILAGLEPPDEGELIARRQLRVAYVPQEEAFDPHIRCVDAVADVMDEHLDDHERHIRAAVMLDRAGFADSAAAAGTLSGGWRKRLAIVRQVARDPDLLLMDEPTNHLDVEGIEWLEQLISGGSFAVLVVSHDRRFLETMANRIIELGRQYPEGFLSHNGHYSDFVEKRADFLEAQLGRQQALASGVRREIEWLRRGAKARTTKAKGRIQRAGEMMGELADLRTRNAQQQSADIDFTASDRRTRKLLQLRHISKSMGGKLLFDDLSITLSPGMRLGLLGPNGGGKSTLIRIMAGQLAPDRGEVIPAEQLRILLFDQHREQLDLSQPLRRALSPSGDNVLFQGNSMHVSGWAKRFLFRTDQLDMPVAELSGGERARVLIARLMLQEADLLILDEPTNDLDIPTLDVLESSLDTFPGALVLVTHDRYLLDRLSTELLALDGKGNAQGYAELLQWEQARQAASAAEAAAARAAAAAAAPRPAAAPTRRRLSWKEQRELEGMDQAILEAEAELERLQQVVADPAVLADHVRARTSYEQLASAHHEVERLYARWAELEALKS